MNNENENEGEELKIILPEQVDDSWEYKVITQPADADGSTLERLFNELGQGGWELKTSWAVFVPNGHGGFVRLVFAR